MIGENILEDIKDLEIYDPIWNVKRFQEMWYYLLCKWSIGEYTIEKSFFF